jgi:hypothetical protein
MQIHLFHESRYPTSEKRAKLVVQPPLGAKKSILDTRSTAKLNGVDPQAWLTGYSHRTLTFEVLG